MEEESNSFVTLTSNLSSGNGIGKIDVPVGVAMLSGLVSNALEEEDEVEEGSSLQTIPIMGVRFEVLQKVEEYCHHFVNSPMQKIEVPFYSFDIKDIVGEWYANYITNITRGMLFELMAAAHYMDIKPLVELTCIPISMIIQGMSSDEICLLFNLESSRKAGIYKSNERKKRRADVLKRNSKFLKGFLNSRQKRKMG